ncbi:uncharacterized protein MONBRDRAFT_17559 [Monosiga brevicollis MX1]|uniref:C2H2-type domain-containing protein n=1 Tax=Monosiga brevicollis TaxID=81824 RepID=A9US85_MONBE|nr:uncharacterized protein MONBRDRAFT_17559 [Monosiga brevicollis MX1]EDQ92056.1 predicted protein [Monosiga brevicollis MX1]|eukprot:XP_001743342.1 hypothetical protein [Monosiga brevicollis MX1]
MHKNIRDNHKKYIKSKRKTKDVDQIHEDFKPEVLEKLMQPEVDGDLPGLGQFYCVHCARYFVNQLSLAGHFKSKVHKRRVKQLSETPYSQAEADAAAGLGTYKPPQRVEVPNVAVGLDTQVEASSS